MVNLNLSNRIWHHEAVKGHCVLIPKEGSTPWEEIQNAQPLARESMNWNGMIV